MDPTETVLQFIEHYNSDHPDAAHELLSDDVFYHNIPMQPLRGRRAVTEFSAQFWLGSVWRADWKVVNIAAAGEMVLTERLDCFPSSTGALLRVPVMGAFRVVNGRIIEWRGYFDLGDFERQLRETA